MAHGPQNTWVLKSEVLGHKITSNRFQYFNYGSQQPEMFFVIICKISAFLYVVLVTASIFVWIS